MDGATVNDQPDYRFQINWMVRSALMMGPASLTLAGYFLYERKFVPGAIFAALAGLVGLFRFILSLIIDPKRRKMACGRMIHSIRWTGNERVLDVGCGNGLVLVAAAKHLAAEKGKATGIDIWNEIAGGQNPENSRRNAVVEGVADRVELREADARNMPFQSGTFDVIFASLSLHHAGGKEGIQRVVTEMKRVLKPGGTVLIYDLLPATSVAARTLRELGMKDVERLSGRLLWILRAHYQKH